MFLWVLFKYIFLYPYILICGLITYYIYNEEKPFYTPIEVIKKDEDAGETLEAEKVNLHDEFSCFRKLDKPLDAFSTIKLFFGLFFLGFPRLIINLYLARKVTKEITKYLESKNSEGKPTSKEDIDVMVGIVTKITTLHLKFAGLFYEKKRLPDSKILPVYKKYFGPDYKIDYDSKFGCYISNHTCVYDMMISMALFGTGFVAKIGASKVPIIGPMNKSMQSIFVDRSSDKAKENILDILEKRERDYYEGKPVMPFMIFPEGTTSSGRHILPFKKGAFGGLLPVKATFIHPNLYENYHIGVGSSDVACNYLRSLANLYNRVEYVELPVLTPNDYMYENFEHFGKEKWEIYAEVCRSIMCELGDFQKSEFGLKDSFRYCSCIKYKKLLDRKSYKIE